MGFFFQRKKINDRKESCFLFGGIIDLSVIPDESQK